MTRSMMKHKKKKQDKKDPCDDKDAADISKTKFFSVTLRREKDMEKALLQLAADWKHEHKTELCLWLALQIRKEAKAIRGGKISRQKTGYFKQCDLKNVCDAGVLELWLVNRIKNLSQKARCLGLSLGHPLLYWANIRVLLWCLDLPFYLSFSCLPVPQKSLASRAQVLVGPRRGREALTFFAV